MEPKNEATTEMGEVAAAVLGIADESGTGKTKSDLIALIIRQQELIVRQTEHLLRAMEPMLRSMLPEKPSKSLSAEVDEILTALAGITPGDMALVGDFARMMVNTIKGVSVVGGGAVAGTS